AVSHRAIIPLIMETDYVTLGPTRKIAQAATAAFDAATFEIWGALAHGARLVGLARSTILSPEALATALRIHEIDCIFLTTAVFNAAVRTRPDIFRPLDDLLFGGEACDIELIRGCIRGGAPRRLVHVYGPTEA